MKIARRGGPALLCALIGLCGCKDRTSGTPHLVTKKQIEELKSGFTAAISAHRKMSCKRPVLRGEALAGSAHKAQVDVYELRGELAPCKKAVTGDGRSDPLKGLLWSCKKVDATFGPVGSDGDSSRCEPTPWTKKPPAEIARVAEACKGYGPALRRAVSHGDACSPYLPGRRWFSEGLQRIRAHHAIIIDARALARKGNVLAAMQLLLDDIRYEQDLCRGGGGVLPAMIGWVTVERDVDLLHALLATHRLDKEQLGTIAAEMERLLATTTDFGAILEDDAYFMAAEMVLPSIEGPGWRPPGEWPEGAKLPPPQFTGEGKKIGSPREEAAVTWMAMNRAAQTRRRACPANRPLSHCVAALEKEVEASRGRMAKLPKKTVDDVIAAGGDPGPVREAIITILEATYAPAFNKYAYRFAHRIARVVALRVAVELERMAVTDSSCPDAQGLARATEKVRSHPALGFPLTIRSPKQGVFDIMSPPWMDMKPPPPGPRPVRLRRVSCAVPPAKAKQK
jgi:hypothetical protein